jgi:hypothetical protein
MRDVGSLRDDRLFIIACDDTYAPKQYFDFFRLTRVQIHVVPTLDGTSAAAHVLTRLLSFEHHDDDERWLVLDVDHALNGGHVASFMEALKRAEDNGINVALSNPCFELWLLLHHQSESECSQLRNAADVTTTLRTKLGSYNKTRLNQAHFPLESVPLACSRAKTIDGPCAHKNVPDNPSTRVYRLMESIISAAHPSQLPIELRIHPRS